MRKPPRQPRWDESDAARVRVLLECPPASSPSIIASAIERRGYAVRTCEGPTIGPCALLDNGACALVDGADAVINMLGTSRCEAPVLEAIAGLRRRPAIVAEVPCTVRVDANGSNPAPTRDPADAVTDLRSPVTTKALFEGIEEALRQREQRVAWWGDGFC